eukprot:363376-Chlamydomonas_euryale.AAC.4
MCACQKKGARAAVIVQAILRMWLATMAILRMWLATMVTAIPSSDPPEKCAVVCTVYVYVSMLGIASPRACRGCRGLSEHDRKHA